MPDARLFADMLLQLTVKSNGSMHTKLHGLEFLVPSHLCQKLL